MFQIIRDIGSVLGYIGVAYGLWLIFRKRLRVSATCLVSEVKLPSRQKEIIGKLLDSQTRIKLPGVEAADIADPKDVSLVRDLIGYSATYSTTLLTILVRNGANVEVKGLQLHLPVAGLAEIEDRPPCAYTKELSIGDLRSRQEVRIYVWTNKWVSRPEMMTDAEKKRFYLSHTDGSVQLLFGETVFGWAGKAIREIEDNPKSFLPVLLPLIVMVGFIAFQFGKIGNDTPSSQSVLPPSATSPATAPSP